MVVYNPLAILQLGAIHGLPQDSTFKETFNEGAIKSSKMKWPVAYWDLVKTVTWVLFNLKVISIYYNKSLEDVFDSLSTDLVSLFNYPMAYKFGVDSDKAWV